MTDDAVNAAAAVLHDEYCEEGETRTCGRWKAGADPASHHARHREYYRDQARAVLQAALPHLGAREN